MPQPLLQLLIDLFRLTLWLVILAIIFVPLERFFAIHPSRRRRPAEVAQDIGFYFLSSLLPAVLISAPLAALVAVSQRLAPGYHAAVADLPLWLRLVLAFAIGEVGFYWGHRWTHQWPWLWRYHALHHRPEGLTWLVNSRAHPVDLVFVRLCGLVPIYLLGLAQAGTPEGNLAPVLVVLVGTIWGFFIHANVRWRLGWLEHLIASPHFHHWHHTRDAPLNRNFASMMPLLDRLFGTHHLPRSWPDRYGVATPEEIARHEAESKATQQG